MKSSEDEAGQVPSIDPGTIATVRSGVASVELDGEIVLYDDETHRFHHLNTTAATLWKCLDGYGSLQEIAADIADIYGVEEARVLPQVLSIARLFAVQGLLEGLA